MQLYELVYGDRYDGGMVVVAANSLDECYEILKKDNNSNFFRDGDIPEQLPGAITGVEPGILCQHGFSC